MLREEEVFFPFSTTPVPYQKYNFGQNDVVQKARTKDIIVYPFYGFGPFDMVPEQQWYNNLLYYRLNALWFPTVLLSIKRRDSKNYAFIDLPLPQFAQQLQIHKNWCMDIKVDFNNSYIRFTQAPGMLLPFIVPFTFRLYP